MALVEAVAIWLRWRLRVLAPNMLNALLIGWLLIAVAVFFILMFVPAPYGRLTRSGWGPRLPSWLNWAVMEAPAAIVFTGVFLTAPNHSSQAWSFFLLWNVHYVYRGGVYPWLVRNSRPVPLTITLSGCGFNVMNGYLQAVSLFGFETRLPDAWLESPTFLLGAALFVAGFSIHLQADAQLRRLRQTLGSGYHVPCGGLFRWVSCPNYFGELLEWIGWAILTWSWSGLVFAIWTAANLIPRSIASHRWYGTHFANYPTERRAILPFVL